MLNLIKARVIKHEKIASTYYDIVLECDERFEFEPGQFVSVKVSEERMNSYSIAGKLSENQFGLLIDVKPGGPGSVYFENLKVGDVMEFRGPMGKFVLRAEDGSEHLLFLGTGSGIAPLKAMIENGLREKEMRVPMTLYFGLRNREDIFWDKYFSSLQDQYDNFEFFLCLSKPDELWQGLSGHITDFLRERYPDCSRYSSYLCGAEGMIKEGAEILAELGMDPTRIYHEKFY